MHPSLSGPALPWPLCVPVLTDGEITLRAHTRDDLEPMLQMAQDEEMQRWTAIPVPHTIEQSEEFALSVVPRAWDQGTARGWAIEAPDAHGRPRYAGNIDVRGNGVADVGFALHPWARGRGVMVRAVQLAVDWTFAEGVAEVVHWRAHVGNEASLRVAHRAGFTLHGTTPGLLWERGRAVDAWTASIRFGDAPLPRTRWLDSVLENDRLRLRPFSEADLPRVVEACSDPVTRHWLHHLPHPYTAGDARDFLHREVWSSATGTKASWVVADRATDALLAHVAIMDLGGLDPLHGEVGYWTHPDARRRGVMTEAVGLVRDWAFAPLHENSGLGLQRLSLYAAVENEASNRVAQANGFTRFGTQREAEPLGDGTYADLEGYELLA
ncbi:hypothetical protein ASD11_10970 [Aeromicrobium sp. Root495]|uniref:GNAT family N-acetyltransferase n=1 Tax=Aeromicrobium sp. Root495 TaxID=1736550 RepID=UPI00070150BE|nr:GNAT family N-acetyltransferase [Aeromicrobium sp. Root495]KQY60014.1 hypothetical protein ASD11_10970 [Aeromicrobium sp. Root495]